MGSGFPKNVKMQWVLVCMVETVQVPTEHSSAAEMPGCLASLASQLASESCARVTGHHTYQTQLYMF